MGKVIRFPVERRKPHVSLSWDDAWGQYLIAGVGAGPHLLEWCDNYMEALDRFISMGERLNLPLVYCLDDGRAAA